MITDHDIMELYRCLLGRAPENANTIQAFRNYYPNLELGRRAVFDSKEFHTYFERVTGRKLRDNASVSAELAFDLLARVGANAPPPPAQVTRNDAVSKGLSTIFRKLGNSLFAVVVGPADTTALEGLVPLGRPECAVLHVAPGFPPAIPLVSRLADGTALFRLGSDAATLAAFLQATGRLIDVLVLLGPPANAGWVDGLRACFAQRTLVIVGAAREGFDSAALSAAIAQRHEAEQVHEFHQLRLHHFGGWLTPVLYTEPTSPPALPDLAAYPKLAIAAIVRNEANSIENMLRSAAPVAGFIAVLDTGSTDDTVSLAKACLESSGVPFVLTQRPREMFDSDFSAMRNAALDMVPATMDWVLMLDSDEEIVAEDHLAFLELIKGAKADAFWLPRYNYVGPDKRGGVALYPDWQIRLIRHGKKPPVRYEGRVHETVLNTPAEKLPLDASIIGGARGGPHIHHLVRRFRSDAQENAKQEFYRQIARETK
jgi:hypothetical protein